MVGCVFVVAAPSWYQLVGFISSAAELTYIVGGVGLPCWTGPPPASNAHFGFACSASGSRCPSGLPFFTAYYAWKSGWIKPLVSGLISIIFFVVWIWTAVASGWVLTGSAGASPDAWPFALYYVVFAVLVLAFCAAVWLFSNAEGRKNVNATWWLIWLLLASLLVGYLGVYGPLDKPVFMFPWGMGVELLVGIVTYIWAVHSGFETPEVRDIVANAAESGADPEPAGAV